MFSLNPLSKAKGAINLTLLTWRRHIWRFHPHRLLPGLNNVLIDRPIFLLGVQGGGLTLLARMLRRHSQIVSVTGNSRYWAGPDEMQNVMGTYLPPELSGMSAQIPPHPCYPERPWLYAIDDLLPLYRRTSSDATQTLKQQFQTAVRLPIAIYGKNTPTPRFIDKSQSFTVRLSLVNDLLKEYSPRFILITRNPYAICYRSATRVQTLLRLNLPLEQRLALTGQHWTNTFQFALEDAAEVTHFKVVRFEDLLKNPVACVKQICEFADISFEPDMLPSPQHRLPLGSIGTVKGDHKWYPLRPTVNQPYLDQLESWMIKIIEQRTGELARYWHYTVKGP